MSWTMTRLKHICVDAGQYGLNISAQDYSSSGHRLIRTSDIDEGGRLRSRDNAVYVDVVLESRHKVKVGDLLISRSGTLGRAMLLDALDESSTYAGYLVRFRPRRGTNPRFMAYVAASSGFQSAIESDAVKSTIQNFNAERYANISISFPPFDEQRRIVDFLDAEIGRLDELIRCRATQKALLADKRKRLVDRAFLGGAGSRCRVKNLLQSKPRYGVLVPEFVDDGVPFVRINDLASLAGHAAALRMIPESLSRQYSTTIVRPNDVLVSVVGTLGRSVVATPEVIGANVNRAIAILRTKRDVSPKLLSAWMGSKMFETQAVLATGNDSAQRTLGMEDLGNFEIEWPECGAEQDRVLAGLVEIETAADLLHSNIDRQLGLLAERRQALITGAVTGQIDVTTARVDV